LRGRPDRYILESRGGVRGAPAGQDWGAGRFAMICEFLDNCPFFNDRMDNMPAATVVFKKIYCQGNNNNCARYMIAKRLGVDNIPSDVYPNNRKAAVKIIAGQTTV
jgi:hypothetical protein